MTDPKTILAAGKQIGAIASGRAYKEDEAEKDQVPEPSGEHAASAETSSEPGNPNAFDHDRHLAGQERAKD